MRRQDWDSLFDRPILVVSGKGGTGKSTVAAALASAAAASGRRVLVADAEGRGQTARTLEIPDPGIEEAPTPFGFAALSIDARAAAGEYFREHSGLDRLAGPLVRSAVLDQIILGAPGLRDVLACGKLYEVVVTRGPDADERGRPRYDLVVVDAPPTGQVAGFLSSPAALADVIRVGRMRRHAAEVARLLRQRAAVVLVAEPEEMSVVETLEALPAVAATGVPVRAIVLNRSAAPVLPKGARRAFDALTPGDLARLAAAVRTPLSPDQAAALRLAAEAEEARHRVQRRLVRRLSTAATVLRLPEVPAWSGPETVRALAATMLRAPQGERREGTDADREGGPPALPVRPGDQPRAPSSLPSAAAMRAVAGERRDAGRLAEHVGDARLLVVCGSGGVGKTTMAAALALGLADVGHDTALLTIDPARRLATALRLDLAAGEPVAVPLPGRRLHAMQLDTQRTFDALVERYAGSPERRERILRNPYYRRIADTLGGTHEYMAMEKLHELAEEGDHARVVVDTPPTRSALSFLEAPARLTDFLGGRFLRWILGPGTRAGRLTLRATGVGARAGLRAFSALVGAEVLRDLAEFLSAFEGMHGGFRERAARVTELLRSPECAFVVVAAPTRPSLEDASTFVERLSRAGMRAGAVVVNRVRPPAPSPPADLERAAAALASRDAESRAAGAVLAAAGRRAPVVEAEVDAIAAFAGTHPHVPVVTVPALGGDVHDVGGLSRVASFLFEGDEAGPAEAAR